MNDFANLPVMGGVDVPPERMDAATWSMHGQRLNDSSAQRHGKQGLDRDSVSGDSSAQYCERFVAARWNVSRGAHEVDCANRWWVTRSKMRTKRAPTATKLWVFGRIGRVRPSPIDKVSQLNFPISDVMVLSDLWVYSADLWLSQPAAQLQRQNVEANQQLQPGGPQPTDARAADELLTALVDLPIAGGRWRFVGSVTDNIDGMSQMEAPVRLAASTWTLDADSSSSKGGGGGGGGGGGSLWLFGAVDCQSSQTCGGECSSDMWRFDVSSEQWTKLAASAKLRGQWPAVEALSSGRAQHSGRLSTGRQHYRRTNLVEISCWQQC